MADDSRLNEELATSSPPAAELPLKGKPAELAYIMVEIEIKQVIGISLRRSCPEGTDEVARFPLRQATKKKAIGLLSITLSE